MYVCKETFHKLYAYITRESLGLRMRSFQESIFIWTQTYRHFLCSYTCFFQKQINFEKFTGKHLCQSPATLLKKKLWYRCFPVNFAIFLRILLFLHNTSSDCFCIFSPSSLHYFLMLQFFTINSVKDIEIIFFYYVYFVY